MDICNPDIFTATASVLNLSRGHLSMLHSPGAVSSGTHGRCWLPCIISLATSGQAGEHGGLMPAMDALLATGLRHLSPPPTIRITWPLYQSNHSRCRNISTSSLRTPRIKALIKLAIITQKSLVIYGPSDSLIIMRKMGAHLSAFCIGGHMGG